MANTADWFSVDKEGLARLLERKGKASAVLELIQNAWDEKGVTQVTISLTEAGVRGRSHLVVEDDAPDGFHDMTHINTLFAPSAKVTDATKRGRFNLGEKLVLAICDSATVASTNGAYVFDQHGLTKRSRVKRDRGSVFDAVIRLTQAERDEVAAMAATLLVPEGIRTTFNGTALLPRTPVRTFTARLRTEVADAEGILKPTSRITEVRLFEPLATEKPHIYEMGIPVVEHDSRWHVDVGQKVPLNFERDNVTPGYQRDLRVALLNETYDLLTGDDATTGWVKEAAGDKRVEPEAVVTVATQRWGEKRVSYDPSDPGANAEAVLRGYTVVHGGSMGKDEWEQVKRAGALLPAGEVTPSHDTIESSPDGIPPMPEEDWRPGHHQVAEYAQALAKDLLGVSIRVRIFNNIGLKFAGAYGHGTLDLNQAARIIGNAWFDQPDQHQVDALLIHEFAHHKVHDHLSEKYHDECCRLGALLRDSTVRLEK